METSDTINRLRERLEAENKSLRQCAKECGVSFATLSRILRGGEMSLGTFRLLDAWMQGKKLKVRKRLYSRVIAIGGKRFRLRLEEL